MDFNFEEGVLINETPFQIVLDGLPVTFILLPKVPYKFVDILNAVNFVEYFDPVQKTVRKVPFRYPIEPQRLFLVVSEILRRQNLRIEVVNPKTAVIR